MTRIVIVPNWLRDQIDAAITKALDGRECDEDTRAELHRQLLVYFDEHGVVPEFTLKEIPNA